MSLSAKNTPNKLKLAVRELVEFSAREGDLFADNYPGVTAIEGIRGHQHVQKSRDNSWLSECKVESVFDVLDYEVHLSGRIDLVKPKDMVSDAVVEEIKVGTVAVDLIPKEKRTLQLAQVKVYAALFSTQYQDWCADDIEVRSTWFNINTKKQESDSAVFSIVELQQYTESLINRFVQWHNKVSSHFNNAIDSARELTFPYAQFRSNQLAFSRYVYRCVRDRESLLVQAPTGMGKTISILFPAVKSLTILNNSTRPQLYFLTCKNSGQTPALEAVNLMHKTGFTGSVLQLQAKNKVCPCVAENALVNNSDDECSRCQGFYDRLPDALDRCIDTLDLSTESIAKISEEYHLCPYALSRQLIPYVPMIVCDINYAFDPLMGFSHWNSEQSGKNRVLLIDEAHNLPGRARSMYSTAIGLSSIQYFGKLTKKALGRTFSKLIQAVVEFLNQHGRTLVETYSNRTDESVGEVWDSFSELLDSVITEFYQRCFSEKDGNVFSEPSDSEFCFEFIGKLIRLQKLLTYNLEGFTLFWDENAGLELVCLSPANVLSSIMEQSVTAIGFSGTLTPLNFYASDIGFYELEKAKKSDSGQSRTVRLLSLPSTYDQEKQLSLITNYIDYSYANRPSANINIAELIVEISSLHQGKYIAYFPSFDSLDNVHEELIRIGIQSQLVRQKRDATEQDKANFITTLNDGKCILALAVLGGVYSEALSFSGGIDGVFIVSIGMPAPSKDQERLVRYYEKNNDDGFSYVYRYPGFTKVQQAVGRLIRSEQDRGVVILIDARFSKPQYRELMPDHWQPTLCNNLSEIKSAVSGFWRKFEPESHSD
ncbi:ATP-dependent DNA helicase [Sessilibacter corallicola]|uniref:ATP-dependent DNA helicase n=1 Tax=Sessilibacter corallicola TaxID=2904075 RepID=A0ABQ0AB20_9GAMM